MYVEDLTVATKLVFKTFFLITITLISVYTIATGLTIILDLVGTLESKIETFQKSPLNILFDKRSAPSAPQSQIDKNVIEALEVLIKSQTEVLQQNAILNLELQKHAHELHVLQSQFLESKKQPGPTNLQAVLTTISGVAMVTKAAYAVIPGWISAIPLVKYTLMFLSFGGLGESAFASKEAVAAVAAASAEVATATSEAVSQIANTAEAGTQMVVSQTQVLDAARVLIDASLESCYATLENMPVPESMLPTPGGNTTQGPLAITQGAAPAITPSPQVHTHRTIDVSSLIPRRT
uniref:Uncharacterized protein n=1 Tax=Chorda asiatica TaxID=1281577 RepID=A0A8F0FCH0_9PHAE|nr:hypothetical protein [Chorda asiatica]